MSTNKQSLHLAIRDSSCSWREKCQKCKVCWGVVGKCGSGWYGCTLALHVVWQANPNFKTWLWYFKLTHLLDVTSLTFWTISYVDLYLGHLASSFANKRQTGCIENGWWCRKHLGAVPFLPDTCEQSLEFSSDSLDLEFSLSLLRAEPLLSLIKFCFRILLGLPLVLPACYFGFRTCPLPLVPWKLISDEGHGCCPVMAKLSAYLYTISKDPGAGHCFEEEKWCEK